MKEQYIPQFDYEEKLENANITEKPSTAKKIFKNVLSIIVTFLVFSALFFAFYYVGYIVIYLLGKISIADIDPLFSTVFALAFAFMICEKLSNKISNNTLGVKVTSLIFAILYIFISISNLILYYNKLTKWYIIAVSIISVIVCFKYFKDSSWK